MDKFFNKKLSFIMLLIILCACFVAVALFEKSIKERAIEVVATVFNSLFVAMGMSISKERRDRLPYIFAIIALGAVFIAIMEQTYSFDKFYFYLYGVIRGIVIPIMIGYLIECLGSHAEGK